jgi:hypothetical protein
MLMSINLPRGLMLINFSVITFFAFHCNLAWNQELANPQKIFADLDMSSYLIRGAGGFRLPPALSKIKVAIFDDGFTGYTAGSKLLPPRTRFIKPRANEPLEENHGYVMAQIFWAAVGGMYSQGDEDGPELFLLHTNGYDNLKDSVDFCIKNKIDIILQSKVSDWGSNFNGTGLINAVVDRAIDAGIVFVNAAGNLHNAVYYLDDILSVKNKDDGLEHIVLPGADNTLNFTNRRRGNRIDISLAWSDFGKDKTFASNKDLDLYLYQKVKDTRSGEIKFVEIGVSEKSQIGKRRPKNNPGSLINALSLERIVQDLDPGEYALKIIYREGKFTAADKLRVIVDARDRESVEFHEALGHYEIAAPADNPRVITVGAIDEISSRGPTAGKVQKPDVLMANSSVALKFAENNQPVDTKGSSTAAAIFAGAITLMKTYFTERVNTKDLKSYIVRLSNRPSSRGGIPTWTSPIPANK